VVCDIVDSTSAVVRAAVCHIIEKYRLRLERGVVRFVNVASVKFEAVAVDNMTNHNSWDQS
jgi:hypothetical protein